jgi:hypothetical protein
MKPLITYGFFSGVRVRFVCDRKCNKAWGMNQRAKRPIEADEHCIQRVVVGRYHAEDFWVMLPDTELGEAPEKPGTHEYTDTKPLPPVDSHNRWCVRECERCETYDPNEPMYIHNFDQPIPNVQASVLATRAPELAILIKEEDAEVAK